VRIAFHRAAPGPGVLKRESQSDLARVVMVWQKSTDDRGLAQSEKESPFSRRTPSLELMAGRLALLAHVGLLKHSLG
jgi:hypothetical protein